LRSDRANSLASAGNASTSFDMMRRLKLLRRKQQTLAPAILAPDAAEFKR
jgi:hypothetical protein